MLATADSGFAQAKLRRVAAAIFRNKNIIKSSSTEYKLTALIRNSVPKHLNALCQRLLILTKGVSMWIMM